MFPTISSLLLLFQIVIIMRVTSAEDFYCSKGSQVRNISNENEGLILTLYVGQSYYSNKMSCEWNIDGGPGKRIQAVVESSNLQFSSKFALCDGYDSVTVKEGDNFLVSWCGHDYPDMVSTRGQHMTVKFTSDESNPSTYKYTGVRIRFKTYNSSSCSPAWKEYQQFCYALKSKTVNWRDAQEACNHEQANLASITSEEELDFVNNEFQLSDKIWIGLNDIEMSGGFKWIDRSEARSFPGFKTPSHNKYHHCVALNVKESELSVEECERSHLKFLCKTGKKELSFLYPVPQEKTNKGENGSDDGRLLLLAFIVPSVVILVAIVGGLCIYWRKTGTGICSQHNR